MTSTAPSHVTAEQGSTSPVGPVPTRRLTDLPPYVFAWLDELKAAARARGANLIDLGMGNPDQPTPAPIIQAIAAAYADPKTHGYPPFRGTIQFRQAAAAFMDRRFGIAIDSEREILCLSGAKEGLAHAIMAFADETTVSLVPDIYYPVHGRASWLIGSRTHFLPLRADRGFLPDLGTIPTEVLQKAKILVLNYPHNPTGAVAPLSLFEEAVALCRRHDMLLISDLAYSELTFDGSRAPSVLQVPGAKEVAIEFHSFSKTFNMAGSRVGFAVGGSKLIDALYGVRTNLGYGTPSAIQAGAAYALDHVEELRGTAVDLYRQRRDVMMDGFRSLGWTSQAPHATMFVWLPVPPAFDAQAWTEHLIDKAGVVVSPGNAFGPGGRGFFRVSLIADVDVLSAAIDRLRAAGIRYTPHA
jgi:Aspartate/tyrosine/aromatic aminotransferase